MRQRIHHTLVRFAAFAKSRKGRIAALLLTCFLILFYFSLPKQLFRTPTSYVIEDRTGQLLGASIATDGQWRFPMTDEVPEKFKACITTFEDKRFRYHFGVDPIAMLRAIYQNVSGKRVVSGGSTLTMQVIRMSRNKPRNIRQKLIEALLAIRLEASHSKKSILQLYCEHAPFGTNVVGLDAAAWRYFNRPPEALSWAESATLAVLPNAPSLVHPGRNRARLESKRNALLDKLVDNKIISQESAELGKLEPLPETPHPLPQLAPHLLERFKKEYTPGRGTKTRIETTLQYELQENVNRIINHYAKNLSANGIHNAAALVLDVAQGATLAYVGNVYEPGNPEIENFVDMISALRSPGSTLKPLLYGAMLTDGLILPHTLIPDIPTQIGGYMPQNYNLGYDGAIPASRALSRSLNIPAVKMLQTYKYPRFHDFLKKVGITTLNQPSDFYGLSMILGGCEVTPWQLAGVYASMARTLNNHGQYGINYNSADYHEPNYQLKPQKVEAPQPDLERASPIDYASLYYTFQAMNEVMRPGDEALWEQFSSSQKIAWKTGTSFGFRDGWAIGLTPQHVVAVWVGNADGEGRPGLTGIDAAAPILFDIFNLLPATSWFAAPTERMVRTAVCRESGHLAGADCPHAEDTYIPANGHRSMVCPYHQTIHTNTAGTFRVSLDCATPKEIVSTKWFILPPAMEYYYRSRNSSYRDLPPFAPGCTDNQNFQMMEMIYPANNAKIYIPLEIDGKRGEVIFSVAHRKPGSKIYWHLNNEFVGTTEHFHQFAMSVEGGVHRLTLVDDQGVRLHQQFEIIAK